MNMQYVLKMGLMINQKRSTMSNITHNRTFQSFKNVIVIFYINPMGYMVDINNYLIVKCVDQTLLRALVFTSTLYV